MQFGELAWSHGLPVLIEQIGRCFVVKGQQPYPTKENNFHHALTKFSSIQDEPTLEAMYALRCAFTHEYGLFNLGPSNKPLRRHAFNLMTDETSPPDSLRKIEWSGTYDVNNLPGNNAITTVNVRKVGDLAEAVVAKVREKEQSNELEIRHPMSDDEFHIRFGVFER